MGKKVARKVRTTPIWYAILLIILGVLLVIGGAGMAETISKVVITVMGVFLLAYGIINTLAGFTFLGILQIIFGILMICFAWFFYWLAFLVLGVILFAYGISRIAHHQGWLITNIINLIVGLAIILLSMGFKFAWAETVVQIIYIVAGALLIVDGILILVRRS